MIHNHEVPGSIPGPATRRETKLTASSLFCYLSQSRPQGQLILQFTNDEHAMCHQILLKILNEGILNIFMLKIIILYRSRHPNFDP